MKLMTFQNVVKFYKILETRRILAGIYNTGSSSSFYGDTCRSMRTITLTLTLKPGLYPNTNSNPNPTITTGW